MPKYELLYVDLYTGDVTTAQECECSDGIKQAYLKMIIEEEELPFEPEEMEGDLKQKEKDGDVHYFPRSNPIRMSVHMDECAYCVRLVGADHSN